MCDDSGPTPNPHPRWLRSTTAPQRMARCWRQREGPTPRNLTQEEAELRHVVFDEADHLQLAEGQQLLARVDDLALRRWAGHTRQLRAARTASTSHLRWECRCTHSPPRQTPPTPVHTHPSAAGPPNAGARAPLRGRPPSPALFQTKDRQQNASETSSDPAPSGLLDKMCPHRVSGRRPRLVLSFEDVSRPTDGRAGPWPGPRLPLRGCLFAFTW